MKMIFLGPNDKNTNGGDRKRYEHYGIDFEYGAFIWKKILFIGHYAHTKWEHYSFCVKPWS